MSQPVRVIQFGLGAIGRATARLIWQRPDLTLVGGVDIDPEKVGRDLGELIGLEEKCHLPVVPNIHEAIRLQQADVVLHTTVSRMEQALPQLSEILEYGLNVVTTAEELSFPWRAHPQEADQLDRLARRQEATILATGVNPGFLMDSLPLFLTAIAQQVEAIRVERHINASLRREPFQRKIGAGLSPQAFQEKVQGGELGHVGLRESMDMLFHALGRECTRYQEQIEPVIASQHIGTSFLQVEPGQVCGLRQTAVGYSEDRPFVELVFQAALDHSRDGDTIQIQGTPALQVQLQGTNGDLCTTAIAVNAIPRVMEAPPGLLTMRDLPLLHYNSGRV